MNEKVKEYTHGIESGLYNEEGEVPPITPESVQPRKEVPIETTENRSGFNLNWLWIPNLLILILLTWGYFQPNHKLELTDLRLEIEKSIENYKDKILSWVNADIPHDVREFYSAELKPGEAIVMVEYRKGDGPVRELRSFEPSDYKAVEKVLMRGKR